MRSGFLSVDAGLEAEELFETISQCLLAGHHLRVVQLICVLPDACVSYRIRQRLRQRLGRECIRDVSNFVCF